VIGDHSVVGEGLHAPRSDRSPRLDRRVREASEVSVAHHTTRALVAQDPGPHPPRHLDQRVGLDRTGHRQNP
jgi:hypothetical protein